MSPTEIKREARKQRRLDRLGCNDPHCGICGETDDRALELHHVAGRKHEPSTVILCRNCHRKVSDDQKDHPPLEDNADPTLYMIGSFLLGLADMLKIIVGKLYEFGRKIIDLASVMAEVAQ